MKKYIVLFMMFSLVFLSAVKVKASVLTTNVPNFEDLAINKGCELDDYNYYFITVRDLNGQYMYDCYFMDSNIVLVENGDTSGGTYSTANFSSYFALTNYVRVRVYTDTDGNITSSEFQHNVNSSMYVFKDAIMLYSNHDIMWKDLNGNISTVFLQAPISKGQRVTIGTTISRQTIVQAWMKQIISLIPSVVALLTLGIGLRKALGMLLVRLKQA